MFDDLLELLIILNTLENVHATLKIGMLICENDFKLFYVYKCM